MLRSIHFVNNRLVFLHYHSSSDLECIGQLTCFDAKTFLNEGKLLNLLIICHIFLQLFDATFDKRINLRLLQQLISIFILNFMFNCVFFNQWYSGAIIALQSCVRHQ